MLDDSEVDDVLEALETHFADSLSPWEWDFVRSVGGQWEERRSLTDKQRAKLDSIFERFARGAR
mgnify:CR=1 FL=1